MSLKIILTILYPEKPSLKTNKLTNEFNHSSSHQPQPADGCVMAYNVKNTDSNENNLSHKKIEQSMGSHVYSPPTSSSISNQSNTIRHLLALQSPHPMPLSNNNHNGLPALQPATPMGSKTRFYCRSFIYKKKKLKKYFWNSVFIAK